MKRQILSLLAISLFSFESHALPIIELDRPELLHHFPRISFIPVIVPGKNGFAYMQEQADGSENLYLAHLTSLYPEPLATLHSQLISYNGYVEDLVTLDASPNNKILRAFSAEVDISFLDLNNRFYNMNDGSYYGLVNEHRFSSLNKSLHPSQRLAEFQQLELDLGVDPESVAEYDYTVETENGAIEIAGFQWNTDGTISISYQLEVYSFGVYIGNEDFTINFTIDSTGISIESYGDTKTAKPEGIRFPVNINASGNMQVRSNQILFPLVYHFGSWSITVDVPRQADVIEASIPFRYRIVYGY